MASRRRAWLNVRVACPGRRQAAKIAPCIAELPCLPVPACCARPGGWRRSRRAPRVVFLNPGEPVERGKGPHWRMTARFMAAAAKTFGMQLEVLYAERDHLLMLRQAESVAQRADPPDYVVIVNEKLAGAADAADAGAHAGQGAADPQRPDAGAAARDRQRARADAPLDRHRDDRRGARRIPPDGRAVPPARRPRAAGDRHHRRPQHAGLAGARQGRQRLHRARRTRAASCSSRSATGAMPTPRARPACCCRATRRPTSSGPPTTRWRSARCAR